VRNSVVTSIKKIALKDKNVMLLSADMGFSVFEDFEKELPKQFLNVGISEANMVGVSAGMALSGKRCFLYTFAPFVSMRCFEQIRIDLCYQNLDVVLIGLGGGLTYAKEGSTHQSVEDIAIMRAIPNMKVFCPADPIEAEICIVEAYKKKGPTYIRIGKSGEPRLHDKKPKFSFGKSIHIFKGNDISIFSTGNMLKTAMDTAKILKDKGISVNLISMPSVKPIDYKAISFAASKTKCIFTIEEHSIVGGFGSAVLEALSKLSIMARIKCFGVNDCFVKYVGDQDFVRRKIGLDSDSISNKILKELGVGDLRWIGNNLLWIKILKN